MTWIPQKQMSLLSSTIGRPQFHSVLIMTKNESFVADINIQAGGGGGDNKKQLHGNAKKLKDTWLLSYISQIQQL